MFDQDSDVRPEKVKEVRTLLEQGTYVRPENKEKVIEVCIDKIHTRIIAEDLGLMQD